MGSSRRRGLVAIVATVAVSWIGVPDAGAATGSWHQVSAPNPGARQSDLLAVSCPTASTCVAVGDFMDAQYRIRTLLVRSTDGTTWTRHASPSHPVFQSELTGVSCWSATGCVAVGFSGFRALALRTTNGTTWTPVALPTLGVQDGLFGVSCRSATACMAVGMYDNGQFPRPWVLRTRNGTKWYRAYAPDSFPGRLTGVSCVTSERCIVVGERYVGFGLTRPVLMRREQGPGWTMPTVPGGNGSTLAGVSCVTIVRCTAVGRRGNGATLLIITTNFFSWAAVAGHAPLKTRLTGVSCRGLRCTAVGVHRPSITSASTGAAAFPSPEILDRAAVIRTTDGVNWSAMTVPDPTPSAATPAAVSCPVQGPCTAVGSRAFAGAPPLFRTLVLREDE